MPLTSDLTESVFGAVHQDSFMGTADSRTNWLHGSAGSRPTDRSGSIAATFGRSGRLFPTKVEQDAGRENPRCHIGCERSSRRDGSAEWREFQRVLETRGPARVIVIR